MTILFWFTIGLIAYRFIINWLEEDFINAVTRGAVHVMSFLMVLAVGGCIHEQRTTREVCAPKTIMKVGACDKYAVCSVVYDDGTIDRYVTRPIEGERHQICHRVPK